MYTDEQIASLIKLDKEVTDPLKNINEGRNAWTKQTCALISSDKLHTFKVFITQNRFFPENFSIGLTYIPKGEKGAIVLMRCNGMHGGTKVHPHHAVPHIHYATAERINNGLKPEGHIEATNQYSTFDTALQYFVHTVGILPEYRQKYFPPPSGQIEMDF